MPIYTVPETPGPDLFPHGEEVYVVSPGSTVDPYSQEPVESWAEADVTTVPVRAAVEPRPSQEPTQDARNAVASGFTLYLPSGTEITAANRVVVRGDVYRVMGEPADWRSPFTGWRPGLVVQVERVEG